MSYILITSTQFDKALKRCVKRGLDMSKLTTAIKILAQNGSLPQNIDLTNCKEIMTVAGNVISNRIGYSYGNRMILN